MQSIYNDAIYKTNTNAVNCRMLVFPVTSIQTTKKTYIRGWSK